MLRLGSTVNMNLDYQKPVLVGSEVLIEATVRKRGKILAFLDCEIRDKETNAVLVKGSIINCRVPPSNL